MSAFDPAGRDYTVVDAETLAENPDVFEKVAVHETHPDGTPKTYYALRVGMAALADLRAGKTRAFAFERPVVDAETDDGPTPAYRFCLSVCPPPYPTPSSDDEPLAN